MRITRINGIRFLEPDEGKILTNGDTFSDGVYLAKNASIDDWTEVDYVESESENDIEQEGESNA